MVRTPHLELLCSSFGEAQVDEMLSGLCAQEQGVCEDPECFSGRDSRGTVEGVPSEGVDTLDPSYI